MSDKIAEIRARYAGYSLNSGNAGKANEDRGWLLAEVERLRAQVDRRRENSKLLVSGIYTITRSKNEEIERLRADLATQQGCCDGAAAQDAHIRREREEMQSAKADAWEDGYEAHRQMIEGIARKPSNPYR